MVIVYTGPACITAIRRVGLLTVEGENDDISGIGQTLAAQDLCRTLPHSMKANYTPTH
jgi:poly(3-hydroxybutyrate) depolymerase